MRCRPARARRSTARGAMPNCDRRLPYPVQYRPDALLNPAVYHDAMPASTIKPIMAAAFLSDPRRRRALAGGRARRDAARRRAGARQSARPVDALGLGTLPRPHVLLRQGLRRIAAGPGTCSRRRWRSAGTPAAPRRAPTAASATCCSALPLDAAPTRGADAPPSTTVAYGRLLSEPLAGNLGAAMHLTPPAALDPALRAALRCRRRRAAPERRRLGEVPRRRGGRRGRRRLGAGPRTRQRARHRRHDGHAGRGGERPDRSARGRIWSSRCAVWPAPTTRARTRPLRAGPRPRSQPNRLSRDAAEVILSGLSYSHRAGTARTACEQVFDARRCRDIDWLAGKTGTPSFPSDGLSLDELARLCRERRRAPLGRRASAASAVRCDPTSGTSPPTAPTAASSGPWTKVIAVLTERNWLRAERPGPRCRRPRPEPVGRDRAADRRPPGRPDRGSAP